MATNVSCRQYKYSPLTYDLTPIFLVITTSNNFYSYFSITNITYSWIKTIIRLELDFNSFIRQSFRLPHSNIISIISFLKLFTEFLKHSIILHTIIFKMPHLQSPMLEDSLFHLTLLLILFLLLMLQVLCLNQNFCKIVNIRFMN